MNSSNQNLLKGIKIFFKAVYIILIAVFCLVFLSQLVLLIPLNREQIGALSIVHILNKPDITMHLSGKDVQPETLIGLGAVIIKGVPAGLKVANALYILTAIFVYILIIRQIRLILSSVEKNEVFSLNNARRLKNTGFLLLINLVLTYSMTYINSLAIHSIDATSIVSCLGMILGEAIGYIIAIVFTFFMAAVFRLGLNLQEENQSFV
jgi:hypothetical protein